MSKCINDCDRHKQYHIYPNEISFEAANITDVSTYKQEIRSNNKENIDQRNPYDKTKYDKSLEVN